MKCSLLEEWSSVSIVVLLLIRKRRVMHLKLNLCCIILGLNTSLVPMYISEIAPLNLRGGLGTVNQLGVTVGILFSQILGIQEILGTESGWPLLLGKTENLICRVFLYQRVVTTLRWCGKKKIGITIAKQMQNGFRFSHLWKIDECNDALLVCLSMQV